MIGLWQLIGFNMVLFLAGLSAIPRDLYDAAESTVQAADRPVPDASPGPARADDDVRGRHHVDHRVQGVRYRRRSDARRPDGSEVLLYAIYLEGFQYFKIGYAAALTLIFLAFILVFSIVQAFLLDRKVHYA